MDVFMVGIYRQGKSMTGAKLLDLDDNTPAKSTVLDVKYSDLYNAIASGKLKVNNLKISKSVLTSIGGSFERYGEPNKTQSLVVLRELQDASGNKLGYMCSDTLGNVKYLTEKEVIKIVDYAVQRFNNTGIANGKVITGADGIKHVSAIDGTYEVKRANSTGNGKTDKTGLSTEVKELIAKAKSRKQYNLVDCYARRVIETVEKSGTCSSKQKYVIEQFTKSTEEKDKPEQKPVTRIVTEQKQETTELLTYDLSDDGKSAYVSGIIKAVNGGVKLDKIDMYIPNYVELSGKKYAVTGIKAQALSGLPIKSIHVESNMADIGQGAFYMCSELEELDLERSSITFVSRNMCHGCYKLKDVKLNSLVQRVHENGFADTSLREIKLPLSCETIARNAFTGCTQLTKVIGSPVVINQSAFYKCVSLQEFDFSRTQRIESNAFETAGFKELNIPGSVNYIGRAAFKQCKDLEEVKIGEGTEVIGEGAFCKEGIRVNRYYGTKIETKIKNAWLPKSLKEIGAQAFDNCEMLHVYTGSIGEGRARGYGWDYVLIDGITDDNATRARLKAGLFGTSITEQLKHELEEIEKDSSNPALEILEDSIESVELNDATLNFLGVDIPKEEKEPHVLFKAALNYFQMISKSDRQPLNNHTIRFADALIVNHTTIMNDGCNAIYKMTFTFKDTLESGEWILVLQGKKLVYLTILNNALDIDMSNCVFENELTLPIEYLHSGDTLGIDGSISGESTSLVDKETGRKIRVGETLYYRLRSNSIRIRRTNKETFWFIPAANKVLLIRDERGKNPDWGKNKVAVVDILEYQEFLKEARKLAKSSNNYGKLFDTMYKMSTSDTNKRLKELNEIAEEKESYFFRISKNLNSLAENSETVSPNSFTMELFNELCNSYFMVEKELAWLNSINSKSLNVSNKYTIGNLKVTEYKSNQVVKFSNAYMSGVKGAYIFVVDNSATRERRAFASRYSLDSIATSVLNMTRYSDVDNVPVLMQNKHSVDSVNPKLFYDFEKLLVTTKAPSISCYRSRYFSDGLANMHRSAEFCISMYKPTGVFYLVIHVNRVQISYDRSGTKEKSTRLRSIPLFPIGDIDRALRVADTTNVAVKDSTFFKDMMIVAVALDDNLSTLDNVEVDQATKDRLKQSIGFAYKNTYEADLSTGDIEQLIDKGLEIYNHYMTAREMLIDGIGDANKYLGLIDSRAVYMVGTVAKGKLQRELGINQSNNFVETLNEYEAFDEDELDSDFEEEDEVVDKTTELADDAFEEDDDDFYEDDEYIFDEEGNII